MNVATGSAVLPAKDGTPWGASWPAPFTFSPPALGVGQIVAAQIAAQKFANIWTLADKLVAADQVWTDTANWQPVSKVAFAAAPVVVPPVTTPPAPGPNVGTLTVAWKPPAANSDLSTPVTPLKGYTVFMGVSYATPPVQPKSLAKLADVPATQLSYTTAMLPVGTYYFTVEADAANGKVSTDSAMVSAILSETVVNVPGQPQHVTLSATLTGATS